MLVKVGRTHIGGFVQTSKICFFQNDSEMFGRTLKVNMAKPLRLKENSTRPVWADDEWLSKYAGQDSLVKQAENESRNAGLDPKTARKGADPAADADAKGDFFMMMLK